MLRFDFEFLGPGNDRAAQLQAGLGASHQPLFGLLGLAGLSQGASFADVIRHSFEEERDAQRAQPADPAAVERLPVRPPASSDHGDCAICLDSLCSGDGRLMDMPCSHAFHERCLKQWLRESSTCPTCRSRLPSASPPARAAQPVPAATTIIALPATSLQIIPIARPQRTAGTRTSAAPSSDGARTISLPPRETRDFVRNLNTIAGIDPARPPNVPLSTPVLERVPTHTALPRRRRPAPAEDRRARGRRAPAARPPIPPAPHVASDEELVETAVSELMQGL